MIALLIRLGLSGRAAKLVGYIALPLLVCALFGGLLAAYGNARYQSGVADSDLKWQAASAKLQESARVSGEQADREAAQSAAVYAEAVEQQKEQLDEAYATGRSPLDVLFPAADR